MNSGWYSANTSNVSLSCSCTAPEPSVNLVGPLRNQLKVINNIFLNHSLIAILIDTISYKYF